MSSSSINNLSSSYLQSVLASALQGTGLTTKTNGATVGSSSAVGLPADNSQLSPFAQLLSTLQQLQQSDPAKYQQITQQIATNLQSAAKTAQQEGNTGAADKLNQLATDFTNASQSGQMPNIQDLAKAIGGGHHHHHHAQATSADADGDSDGSSASSATSSSQNQSVSQLLAAFQTNSTSQSNSLNPLAIIMNTLSGAGIGGTNS